jgi:hypothetical protein
MSRVCCARCGERALDEPLGRPRRQDQGVHDNEQHIALRTMLDLGESLRLAEAEADKKIFPHSGEPDCSLHAVNVHQVGYGPVVEHRIFACRQLLADE